MKTMESPYSLQELLLALWRKKWLLIIMTVLGIFIGYIIAEQMKPKYEATSEVFIDTNKSDNYLYTQSMMETYRAMLTSTALINKVNDAGNFDLTAKEYNDKVSISMVNTSQLVKITVRSAQKDEPVQLVNKIVNVFQNEISEYSKINKVVVLNAATDSTSNQDRQLHRLLSILIGGIIGLLLAIVYCIVREVYGTKVDDASKVQRLHVPLLAHVYRQSKTDEWTYHAAAMIALERHAGKKAVLLLNDTSAQTDAQQLRHMLAHQQRVAVLKRQDEPNDQQENDGSHLFTYDAKTPVRTLQRTYDTLMEQYDIVLIETHNIDSIEMMLAATDYAMFIYIVDGKRTALKHAQSILKKVSQLKMHILGIVIAK